MMETMERGEVNLGEKIQSDIPALALFEHLNFPDSRFISRHNRIDILLQNSC